MKILLARVIRGEDEKVAIDEQRKALNAAYIAAEKRRDSAATAFEAFGFNTNSKELWKEVKAAMGPVAWSEGFVLGGRMPVVTNPQEAQSEEADQSTKETDEAAAPAKQDIPTVREIVLAQLGAAGDAGVKAANIRKFIEETYSQTVHEKTVGMTLYRLSKDGLARRDGRTWFSVTPSAETENPGVDAPGSEEGVFS